MFVAYSYIKIFQVLHCEIPDPFDEKGVTTYKYHANPSFHGNPLYDWVVIYDKKTTDEEWYGIDNFVVGQLKFLAEIEMDECIHHLALIHWFDLPGKRDPETKMSIAIK